MDIVYTPLNLIRYYYCETDLFESLEIEHALEEDIDLKFEYKMMKKSLNEVSKTEYSPSFSSISNILNYSRRIS